MTGIRYIRPATPAERALVAAAIAVYREMRADGASQDDAWGRVTDLTDDALVGPALKADMRLRMGQYAGAES